MDYKQLYIWGRWHTYWHTLNKKIGLEVLPPSPIPMLNRPMICSLTYKQLSHFISHFSLSWWLNVFGIYLERYTRVRVS